jgi:photosystem II stability/assembly factor-like uncharacterized protein
MRRRRWVSVLVLALIVLLPAVPAQAGGGDVLISFVDAHHGWVGLPGASGTRVFRTVDGGRHWQESTAPIGGDDIQFANRSDGWLAGFTPRCALATSPSCRGVLAATRDGGRTWRVRLRSFRGYSFTRGIFQVLDARHVIVGESATTGLAPPIQLYATSNGGTRWRELGAVAGLSAMDFVTPRLGWFVVGPPVVCHSEVVVTRDGGETVSPQLRLPHACDVQVDFISPRRGWVLASTHQGCPPAQPICYHYALYGTTDGGAHWTELQWPAGRHGEWLGQWANATAVDFATPKVGWVAIDGAGPAVGQSRIAYTTDGGRHWRLHSIASPHLGIALVDARHGFVMACSLAGTCLVHRTTDGGRTFTMAPL